MISVLQQIFEKSLERLGQHLTTYIPPLIVALIILAVTFVVARVARWLILKVVKGISLDRFLQETGVAFMLGWPGRIRGAVVVAGAAYWMILGIGVLTALDVFDTKLTSQIVESTVFLFPKLLTASAIVIAGVWLARFLSRGMLVWAVNEGIPFARRLAAIVNVAVIFGSIAVASEVLNFASQVFFAAFVIFAGMIALSIALAMGLGIRGSVERYLLQPGDQASNEPGKSLWNHL